MGTVFIKVLEMCFWDKDQCSFHGPRARSEKSRITVDLILNAHCTWENLLITKHAMLKPFHFHVV